MGLGMAHIPRVRIEANVQLGNVQFRGDGTRERIIEILLGQLEFELLFVGRIDTIELDHDAIDNVAKVLGAVGESFVCLLSAATPNMSATRALYTYVVALTDQHILFGWVQLEYDNVTIIQALGCRGSFTQWSVSTNFGDLCGFDLFVAIDHGIIGQVLELSKRWKQFMQVALAFDEHRTQATTPQRTIESARSECATTTTRVTATPIVTVTYDTLSVSTS
jgi:hypothetical protein